MIWLVNTVCWENINIGKSSKVGEKIENFVFNYFDYVLWKDNKEADFVITDSFVKKIDLAIEEKTKELMTV